MSEIASARDILYITIDQLDSQTILQYHVPPFLKHLPTFCSNYIIITGIAI